MEQSEIRDGLAAVRLHAQFYVVVRDLTPDYACGFIRATWR